MSNLINSVLDFVLDYPVTSILIFCILEVILLLIFPQVNPFNWLFVSYEVNHG